MSPTNPPALRAIVLAFLAGLAPANAQFDLDASPVEASLVADVATVAPGEPFGVALRLVHQPGWHTYYKNPGTVGSAPSVEWRLPAGFNASELAFPVPLIGTFAGERFYGYDGDTWFLATITPPEVLPETVTLEAKAAWLACKEQCIPGHAELRLDLPTGAAASPNEAAAADFARARTQLPLAKAPWEITATDAGERILLELRPGKDAVAEPAAVHFFSSDRQDDASQPQQLTARPDGSWQLEVPRATEDPLGTAIERLPHLSGILSAGSGWVDGRPSPGILLDRLPFATATAGNSATAATTKPHPPLVVIAGLMLLGGLILNLMPCVFPVIGLKIMHFVQKGGENRRQVMIHGLVFSAGVLASFWVLSGVLFVARQTLGDQVNWGYQLQNPWVVMPLMVLMFLLALNMFGVFEIGASATGIGGTLQAAHGLLGSFFSGVLATVVATPCSAPFLGAGIGAAIGLPAGPFFLAFTAMAVGLALPYLVLSTFPQLIAKLPRPGPWMESFKQGMSFLLFATAGFLLWVYVGLVELPAMLDAVLGLSAIAVAAWVHGRWNVPAKPRRTRLVAGLTAAAFAVAGVVVMRPKQHNLEWGVWSEAEVERLLAEGRPVYVDFTAQWCLTCQVNKKRAYPDQVAALMNARRIAALKADYTDRQPAIGRAIRGLGRGAVPVNVLYVPGKDPIVTPELLSPDYLLELFEREVPK
jgi:DsbC/DsbD-like thiol-disulfide interchange protein/cytochrome c biogenesis protein CcdA